MKRRRRQKDTIAARRAAIALYAPTKLSEAPFNPVLPPVAAPRPKKAHEPEQPRRNG